MTEAATDHRPMWTALGLDLDKHDALLSVLGEAYGAVFLSQRDRPEGMRYFDFVMSEVHGLRIQELVQAREQGRIVVGAFCTFVPEELVLAVDGISVGLCAGAEFGTEAAETLLPRNTCALIKSAFGFTLERVCPYVSACDLIVGENTCDGKKKAWEHYAPLVKRFHALDVPNAKSEAGRALLRAEYGRLAELLQQVSGRTITAGSLASGIETVNRKRAAMHRLSRLRAARPAPISGLDALLVNQVYFYDDPARFTASVEALCDELEQRAADGVGVAAADAPRLLLSGCPMAVPNWKVPAVIEGAGAVIVGEESCVGDRGTQNLTAADGSTVEAQIDAIAERYLTIDCAIFTPNPSRTAHALALARENDADGVVHYCLQFCQPYQMESVAVDREIKAAGLPLLQIDTDYGQGDVEQLRTRIEAFLEQIRG